MFDLISNPEQILIYHIANDIQDDYAFIAYIKGNNKD